MSQRRKKIYYLSNRTQVWSRYGSGHYRLYQIMEAMTTYVGLAKGDVERKLIEIQELIVIFESTPGDGNTKMAEHELIKTKQADLAVSKLDVLMGTIYLFEMSLLLLVSWN